MILILGWVVGPWTAHAENEVVAVAPSPAPSDSPPSATVAPPNAIAYSAPQLRFGHHLTLQARTALKRYEFLPAGLTRDETAPPPVGLSYEMKKVRGEGDMPASFMLSALALFQRGSESPSLGLSPGVRFVNERLEGELSGDLLFQNISYSRGESGSSYGQTIASILGKLFYRDGPFTIGSGFGLRFPFTRGLSNAEGFETATQHKRTIVFSPFAEIETPFALRFRGGLDFYSLGQTAVGSKTFAYGISEDFVSRASIGASVKVGRFDFFANAYFVGSVEDEGELQLQAPFLDRDYLLSPKFISGGVTWNL